MKNILLFSLIILVLYSCNSSNNNNSNTKNQDTNKTVQDTTIQKKALRLDAEFIVKKPDSERYRIGDDFTLSVINNDSVTIDSVQFYINGKFIKSFDNEPYTYNWNSKNTSTGKQELQGILYKNDQNIQLSESVTLFSNVKAKNYGYKVKNVYKHDKDAYTQGLFYDGKYLYEATGLKGASSIRKTKLETGEILQSFTIPSDVFGEGICQFENKIIQLSWQAHRAYVYDKESFNVINQFNYDTEGWGLTTDGKQLIMSNGTHILQLIETQSFTVYKKIEIADYNGFVQYLNELEFINGKLYANIYQSDKIAIIDIEKGRVEAYINLFGILPKKDIDSETDVLNGIAYDKTNDRLFVTGKKWPKLFEIEIKK